MRLRWALPLVIGTASIGLGLFAPLPAPASCVGPSLEVPDAPAVAPPTTAVTGQVATTVELRPGDDVTVQGRMFFDGCNEAAAPGGCSLGPEYGEQDPARAVQLVLTQGSRTWTLGTEDASGSEADYGMRWQVTLPTDLAPGAAKLTARSATVLVRVGDPSSGTGAPEGTPG